MKKVIGSACLLTMLAIGLMAAPLFANNQSTLPKRAAVASRYNMAKEVTLQGTIQSVDRTPKAGMMFGAHLTVATAHGTVSAQIGRSLFRGPHAVSFAPGQQVKLVGMMTTINHHSVLLTRLIETGNQTITVRNERGFPVSPAARMRLTRISTTGGAR